MKSVNGIILWALAMWALASHMSLAGAQTASDIQAEVAQETAVTQPAASTVTTQTQLPTQKVLILNNQPVETTTGVVQQPTTNVIASPVIDSRAEQIRKSRQDIEVQTEQRIVEKLEESRIQDEKQRAERLFGNQFVQPVVVAPSVTPVVAVAPAHQHVPEAEHPVVAAKVVKEVLDDDYYVSGMLGLSEYPEITNVEGNWASGFSAGAIFNSGVIVEGSFIYSNFYVTECWKWNPFKEMDQYTTSFAVKYSIPFGIFRPWLGGLMAYNYRSFSQREINNWGYYQAGYYTDEATSQAIDIGFVIGGDIEVNRSLSFGVEYRYSINLTSWNDANIWYPEMMNPGFATPIEELDYSSIMATAKLRF